MASTPGTLQSRTQSRAKRLGLKPSNKPYTRGQARKIKRQLRAAKSGGQPGPLNSGNPSGGTPAPSSGSGGVEAPGNNTASSRPPLTSVGRTGVNRVTSGAGSARQGQSFQVKKTDSGQFVHVYGRGKKAKRQYLRKSVAKAYGYIK